MGLKTQLTCDAPGCSSITVQTDTLGWFVLSLITSAEDGVASLVVLPIGGDPCVFGLPGSGTEVQHACGRNCAMKLIEPVLVRQAKRVRSIKAQNTPKHSARVQ